MKRASFIAALTAITAGILGIAVAPASAQEFFGGRYRHRSPTIMPFLPPPPPPIAIMPFPTRITFGGHNWRITIGSEDGYGYRYNRYYRSYNYYNNYAPRYSSRGYAPRWRPYSYYRPSGYGCAAWLRWRQTGRR